MDWSPSSPHVKTPEHEKPPPDDAENGQKEKQKQSEDEKDKKKALLGNFADKLKSNPKVKKHGMKKPAAAAAGAAKPPPAKLLHKKPAIAVQKIVGGALPGFPGTKKHPPIHYGNATVYYDGHCKSNVFQWRVKPEPSSRYCKAFGVRTKPDAQATWRAVRDHLATIN